MPGGWSKPREFARLADTRAEFEVEIPVGELPGIPADWTAVPTVVSATVKFARERGHAVADVAIRGELAATCQRCLQAMGWPLDSGSRVALVASEAEAGEAPAEYETFLAAEGRCDLAALVAEEVLLSLPLVPHHPEGAACEPAPAGAAAVVDADAAPTETQRPFADLRALLERDGH